MAAKLLILTQKVDKDDGVLGFFHAWIAALAVRFDGITVICLEKGACELPGNVTVLSLGKESGASRLRYVIDFYRYIWRERNAYDSVFVHMNQEYVLLGWLPWRILRKKIFFWRNHPLGNHATNVAVSFADAVFCTSPYAYTAQFKNTLIMPVGIDTDVFVPPAGGQRKERVLFFGRISPIKKPEVLIGAVSILQKKGVSIFTDIMGPVPSIDEAFFSSLKAGIEAEGLSSLVTFLPPVSPSSTPGVLSSYLTYVNATPTGSMDKVIFEAMACGTLVITSNKALEGEIPELFIFEEGSSASLAEKLGSLSKLSPREALEYGKMLRNYVVERHSLAALIDRLSAAIQA